MTFPFKKSAIGLAVILLAHTASAAPAPPRASLQARNTVMISQLHSGVTVMPVGRGLYAIVPLFAGGFSGGGVSSFSGLSGTISSAQMIDPYVPVDGTMDVTGGVTATGVVTASSFVGAVPSASLPDPYVPVDGTANVTGALAVSSTVTGSALQVNDANVALTETGTNDLTLTADGAAQVTISDTGLVFLNGETIEISGVGTFNFGNQVSTAAAMTASGFYDQPTATVSAIPLAATGWTFNVPTSKAHIFSVATVESARINNAGFSTGLAITSTLATGTAPLTIASTTKVTNLNVDQVDGASLLTGATASVNMFNTTTGGTVELGGTTLTVAGAAAGDPCSIGTPAGVAEVEASYYCVVTATDTVSFYRSCNNGETAGVANSCADEGSLVWKAAVTRF